MNLVKLLLIITWILTWNTDTNASGQSRSELTKKPFPIFDATLYSDKPDLSTHGLQPIALVYAGKFGNQWHKQSNQLPNMETVQGVAREAETNGYPVVIDIEHWSLKGAPDSVNDSLQKYMTVLDWFKKSAPNLTVGYYGMPPLRDYWRAIKDHATQDYRSWVDENDAILPLTSAVDNFYPSLYTFYSDQEGWKQYAIAQIEQARRYGAEKPIYVFLWPQYHDSNRILGGRYLPEDYWRLELETAKQYADGIVIWGGWDLKNNRKAKWDDNAPWWRVTKEFMKRFKQSQPANGTH